jgi:HD superfamily phosphodiesterase
MFQATEHYKRHVEFKIIKQHIVNPLFFHLELTYPENVQQHILEVCFIAVFFCDGLSGGL